MSNYTAGTQLYIARSGLPEYMNRMVTVQGPGSRPNIWVVSANGWTFPNGSATSEIDDAYLSMTPIQS
jgi:hypothetical protein